MARVSSRTVGIIVAHPDDETLWAGGTILGHPSWSSYVVCLCRASDTDRAPKFRNALKELHSEGIMGDLDDGPDQNPLDEKEIERTIMDLVLPGHFDLIITHNISGEYTRHIRHEEVSKAVISLWIAGRLQARELWTFAYEDGGGEYYPKPVENAPGYRVLNKRIWLRKYHIITETYGFDTDSFEAKTTPLAESFWQFTKPYEAENWLINGRIPSNV